MQFTTGMSANEFMRVNHEELRKYSKWILGRHGIRVSEDELTALLSTWLLDRASGVLRTYDPAEGSTFTSYLRFCLERAFWAYSRGNSDKRWYESLTSMDERGTDVGEHVQRDMHECIGLHDRGYSMVETRHDIKNFMAWCSHGNVKSWRRKKRLIELLLSGLEERNLSDVIHTTRQNVYFYLSKIRQDYGRYLDGIASLC